MTERPIVLSHGEAEIDASDAEKAAIRAAVARHYGVEVPDDAPVFRYTRRLAASCPNVHVAVRRGANRANYEIPDMPKVPRSFVEQALLGLPGPTIDAHVARWHDGAGRGLELHEHLGMSYVEYARWVADPASIDAILAERRSA